MRPGRLLFLVAFLLPALAQAASPVWKVSAPQGGVLYLGGSVHALRSNNEALPPAFDLAFTQSSRLVFEAAPEKLDSAEIWKSGEYPKGDTLKNHIDPRTYDYLKRVFTLLGVPEAKMARCRPWLLTLLLWSPELRGLSSDVGVESRLGKRARAKGKSVSGLVSAREHMNVFKGLSERQIEGVLLITFIPTAEESYDRMMTAWRRGDVDFLWRRTRAGFAEYPAFGERLLEARNRAWVPKIESLLRGKETCFVVVGSAHLGGPEGVITLLRKRGYRVEQL